MTGRGEEIRQLVSQGGGGATICRLSAELTGTTGAGILLMTDDEPLGSFCSSDAVSGLIEELQFTLGEGPCLDAHRSGRPVSEPDLASPVQRRWLAFSPMAVDAGVRAIFGFPLHVGEVRVGSLDLYRDRSGPLSVHERREAEAVAEVAAGAVLAGAGRELDATDLRLVVHQAAGMVSVQLGIQVSEAVDRLRARAFTEARSVTDVAADVVARRVRFR